MGRRNTAVTPAPAARVVYMSDPIAPRDPVYFTPKRVAHRRLQYAALEADWNVRQATLIRRDRKVRMFWFGFGATVALAVLAGVGVLVWQIWQAVTGVSVNPGAIGLTVVVFVVAAGIGHRCVTVVQHWH